MRLLAATDVLEAWESLEHAPRAERPLLLLSVCDPDTSLGTLRDLPIGERDARLFALRERTFGRDLVIFAMCPECGEKYELSVATECVLARHRPWNQAEGELSVGAFAVRYRLPNSRDMELIAGMTDLRAAQRLLVERCVCQALENGASIDPALLPVSLLERLGAELEERDPLAAFTLDFKCSSCGREWQRLLDIAEFFWVELRALARRLLAEVHALARAYGWRESDILTLSARRRQAYLGMIGT
jgi:hypothetical protein